jgi:hypothetical protein
MAVTKILGTQIKDADITDTQISATAAIALSKLAESVIQADGGQAFTANQPMGGYKLTGLAAGTSNGDSVRYEQIIGLVSGVDWKDSVRVATAAALPAYTRTGNVLLADANADINTAGIDSITNLVVTDRVLVKNGAAGADNGIYTVTVVGDAGTKWELTRATDANASNIVTNGLTVPISEGTVNGGSKNGRLTTADPITLNTTALTFTIINAPTNDIYGETPAGTADGTNPTFTLASTPVAGTVRLYNNGMRLNAGGSNDYTISGLTITFAVNPLATDTLLADYQK